MFFEVKRDLEEKVSQNERSFKKLLVQIEGLDREIGELMKELPAEPEQLTMLVSSKEVFCKHFPERSWEQLQEERAKLDNKLRCELDNITDPKKVQKARESLNVPRYGFFVR